MSTPCPICLTLDCPETSETDSLPSRKGHYFVYAKHLYSEHFSGLFSSYAITRHKGSDFIHLIARELAMAVSFPQSKNSLVNHIPIVFQNGSSPKMIRINAISIVSTGTIMKNPHSIRNWTFVDYPRSNVCAYSSRKWIAPTNGTIAAARNRTNPKLATAIVGQIKHLAEKPLHKIIREALRLEKLMGNLVWHIKSRFFDVFAPVRRQPTGAPTILPSSITWVNPVQFAFRLTVN